MSISCRDENVITFLIIKNTPLDAEMDENFGEIAGFWKLLQLHTHASHVTHIVSGFSVLEISIIMWSCEARNRNYHYFIDVWEIFRNVSHLWNLNLIWNSSFIKKCYWHWLFNLKMPCGIVMVRFIFLYNRHILWQNVFYLFIICHRFSIWCT